MTAVDDLVQAAEDAADSTDVTYLAGLLHRIRIERQLLAEAETDLESALAELLPRQTTEAGPFRLERRGGRNRKGWRSEELFSELVRMSNVDGNGELTDPGYARGQLIEMVRACVPLTASLAWRSGALRQLGLDPDEWCESTPGRVRVEVHPVAPEEGDRG